jgi:hypothetical protein
MLAEIIMTQHLYREQSIQHASNNGIKSSSSAASVANSQATSSSYNNTEAARANDEAAGVALRPFVMFVAPFVSIVQEKLAGFERLWGAGLVPPPPPGAADGGKGRPSSVLPLPPSPDELRKAGGRVVRAYSAMAPVRDLDDVDVAVCTPEKGTFFCTVCM